MCLNMSVHCVAKSICCERSLISPENSSNHSDREYSRSMKTCGRFDKTFSNTSRKRRIVLASGVFDLLHLGHVRFLEEAKRTGGPNAELVVIVARDRTAEKRKGMRPVFPENQRCALIGSLKVVDEAILGYEDFDIGKVIEKIKPDVIALGHDQKDMEKTLRDYVKGHKRNIKIVRIGKFSSDELDSSSKIKQKIIEDFKR